MVINIDEELEMSRVQTFRRSVVERVIKYGIWAAINEESVIRLQSSDWSRWLKENKGKVHYICIGRTSSKGTYVIVMSTYGFYTTTPTTYINKPICHFMSEEEKECYRIGKYLEEYRDPRCPAHTGIIGPYPTERNTEMYMKESCEQKMEEKKMKKETCQFKVMWKGTATILFRNGKRVSVSKVHGEDFDKTKGLLMCIWKMKFTHSNMKSTLKRRKLEGSQDAELAILYERAYMISHLDDDAIKRIVKSAKEDKKLDCWYAEF